MNKLITDIVGTVDTSVYKFCVPVKMHDHAEIYQLQWFRSKEEYEYLAKSDFFGFLKEQKMLSKAITLPNKRHATKEKESGNSAYKVKKE